MPLFLPPQDNGNLKYYVQVPIDFTSATWNTVATHEVLTITGLVRMQIIPEVITSLTGGAGALISLGFETGVTGLIGATVVTAFTNTLIMLNATPADTFSFTSVFDKAVSASDFGFGVSVNPLTGGTMKFHCYWEPINQTTPGNVVAGLGGVL
jgi:hypothetical protein